MSGYRQLLYHVVFRTKNSIPSLNNENAEQLFSYINGIIRNKQSHLYRVNGSLILMAGIKIDEKYFP